MFCFCFHCLSIYYFTCLCLQNFLKCEIQYVGLSNVKVFITLWHTPVQVSSGNVFFSFFLVSFSRNDKGFFSLSLKSPFGVVWFSLVTSIELYIEAHNSIYIQHTARLSQHREYSKSKAFCCKWAEFESYFPWIFNFRSGFSVLSCER